MPEAAPPWFDRDRRHKSRHAADHVHDRGAGEVRRSAAGEEPPPLPDFSVWAGPAVRVPRPVHHLIVVGIGLASSGRQHVHRDRDC